MRNSSVKTSSLHCPVLRLRLARPILFFVLLNLLLFAPRPALAARPSRLWHPSPAAATAKAPSLHTKQGEELDDPRFLAGAGLLVLVALYAYLFWERSDLKNQIRLFEGESQLSQEKENQIQSANSELRSNLSRLRELYSSAEKYRIAKETEASRLSDELKLLQIRVNSLIAVDPEIEKKANAYIEECAHARAEQEKEAALRAHEEALLAQGRTKVGNLLREMKGA